MRYSYEFNRKCVEMYYQGRYPDTPEGVQQETFHGKIRQGVRIEEANGPDALRNEGHNKVWTPESKLELVSKVIAGASDTSIALNNGISDEMLYQWVCKYKIFGIIDLSIKRKEENQRVRI